VRSYLEQVSAALAAALAREAELTRLLDQVEAASADPATLTREQLMVALGAEADAVLEKRARQAQARMAEGRARAEREIKAELDAAKARGREVVVEAQAQRDRIVAEVESKQEQMEARRDRLVAEIAVLEQGRDRLLDIYRRVRQAVGAVESDEGVLAVPAADDTPTPVTDVPTAPPAAGRATVEPEPEPAPENETPAVAPPEDGVHDLFARLESEVTRPPRRKAPSKKARAARANAAAEADTVELAADDRVPLEAKEHDAPAPVEDEAGEPAELVEASETAGEEADAAPARADDPAIAARDEVLAPLAAALARTAKRAIQDEQNALLDSLRRRRPSTDPLAVVPPLDEHARAWTEILGPSVDRAYTAAYLTEAPAKAPGSRLPESAPAALVGELAHSVVVPLRERIIGALRSATEVDTLGQRVSARYREWRGQHLEATLLDALAIAYARGVYDGSPEGSMLRWVPNQVGQCPDADDNALEPTRRGGQFPTGQQYPPAHPGCRCALAVVTNDADDGSRAEPSTTNA
jgi:hypothetical protein